VKTKPQRILGVGWLCVAWLGWMLSPLSAGEVLPKLGSWELTFNDSRGGNASKTTVTFIRRDADRIYGVIEWRSDGPLKTLEIFSATVNRSNGAVRLDGREEHTQVKGMFPGRYQGKLSEDGRSLSAFRGVGFGSTGATGSLRWVKNEVPAYPAVIAAALSLAEERPLLYQQLSSNYALQGNSVRHGPDIPLLKDLIRSKDKHVRELAALRLALQGFYEQALTRDAREAAAWAANDLDRRAAIFRFLTKAFSGNERSDNSIKAVGEVLNDIGLEKAFDRKRSAREVAFVQMIAMNHFRERVKADYLAHNSKKLDQEKLLTGFKLNSDGVGTVTLKNNTGRDLHNCFIGTQMTVDEKKLELYEKDAQRQAILGKLLAVAVRLDPKIVQSVDKGDQVYWKYFRLEQGSPGFVPLWPKDAVVEVEVSMPGAITYLGKSIGAWVGADEGSATITLDLNYVRNTLRKPR
jgi:hypothetical protein